MELDKRPNPMSVRSKAALATGLLKLMLIKDFQEITVSEITSAAKLSRQTFYTNFEKREDILDYMLAELFHRYGALPPRGGLTRETLLTDYLLFWNSQREFLQLLSKQGLLHLFQRQNSEFFASRPERLQEVVCAPAEVQPYIFSTLAGVTGELVKLWLTQGSGLSLEALAGVGRRLAGGALFRGIRP